MPLTFEQFRAALAKLRTQHREPKRDWLDEWGDEIERHPIMNLRHPRAGNTETNDGE